MKVLDLCHKLGISEAQRLRQLEDENQRLKRMVADRAPDIQVLKDALGKSRSTRAAPESRAASD
jgi:putative transposase